MPKHRLGAFVALAIMVIAGALVSVPAVLSSGAAALPPPAPINGGDTAWMIVATAMVLLMTPGLAFFYGGMVSKQHVIGTMFQSFIAMGVVSLLWVVVGFSLSFGTSIHGLIGDPRTFFMFRDVGLTTNAALAPTIPLALFALFQMKFAIITPALVTGSFAERIKFSSFIWFMILFTLFVYAPLAHWTWHPDGFLHKWGVLDFAGGTVVHMAAGFAGLAGALAVSHGPKKGATANLGHTPQVPANIPFVLLGTGLLWFGWFGFNAGSELAVDGGAVSAFLTTNTAAAAAMVAWLLTDLLMGRKVTALNAAIGAVVGLVAVTPAAGFVNVGASIAIGTVAALVSNLMLNAQWLKARIPDTLDVFACHGVGGIVGMILTAVFALKGGLITGDATLLLKHLAAAVLVAVYTFGVSALLYRVVGFIGSLSTSNVLSRDGAAFDLDLGDMEGIL
jgi:Amt family ammonium transporter